MKIAVWMPHAPTLVQDLATDLPEHEILAVDDRDGLEAVAPSIDALALTTPLWTADLRAMLAAHAPNLRWLQVSSTGIDGILAAGLPPGVTLTNSSGVHGPTVADHAMALLLGVMRRLHEMERARQRRHWDKAGLGRRAIALEGRRVLVLGNGPIGRAVAKRVHAFDAEVVIANRKGVGDDANWRYVRLDRLADVLPSVDAVVVCLPLAPETRGLLDARSIASLPAHAVVVNIGRGAIIDQDALVAALREGRIGGAGLDVMTVEPIPKDDPLWALENVILAPHIAGSGGRTQERHRALIVDNARRFAAGELLRNVCARGETR